MLKNILLATKFSKKAPAARDIAIELVKGLKADLHILYAYDSRAVNHDDLALATIPEELKENIVGGIQSRFDTYLADFRHHNIKPTTIVRFGDPETVILETAREVKADLIIVGASTRKTLLWEKFLQNLDDRVRRKAPCHVLTII